VVGGVLASCEEPEVANVVVTPVVVNVVYVIPVRYRAVVVNPHCSVEVPLPMNFCTRRRNQVPTRFAIEPDSLELDEHCASPILNSTSVYWIASARATPRSVMNG